MHIVETVSEQRRLLAQLIASAERVVAFTGAGISTESGIPDFRSPGGLWSRMKPIEYADFVASEAARLEDWRRRFHFLREFQAAAPNVAHRTLAELAVEGRVIGVVTQNIDGLHQRAGTPPDRLVELHGNGTYATCLTCNEPAGFDGLEAEIAATGKAPRCRHCGGLLKAAVISFGQSLSPAAMWAAEELAEEADLYLAIGSSLVVQPAATFPVIAKRAGARLVIVNREPTPLDALADHALRGPIGTVFDFSVP